VNLYNNKFTGPIPTNWNLRSLFYLDLGRNDLTGTIPADWVKTMYQLRVLYLNDNRLAGSLPVGFELLGNNRLEALVVSDNQLTGQIPSGFGLHTMYFMDLQNNTFSSMDEQLCTQIVFEQGEMVSIRSDCQACPCPYFCGPNQCY
jgi:hypothetical protein